MGKWMTEPRKYGKTHWYADGADRAKCGRGKMYLMGSNGVTKEGYLKVWSKPLVECTDLQAAKLCRSCVYSSSEQDSEYERRCAEIKKQEVDDV